MLTIAGGIVLGGIVLVLLFGTPLGGALLVGAIAAVVVALGLALVGLILGFSLTILGYNVSDAVTVGYVVLGAAAAVITGLVYAYQVAADADWQS